MTLTDFITKYNGKYIDFDGVYGPQCVDLVRQYILEVLVFPNSSLKPVVGAKDFYNKFDVIADQSKFLLVANTITGVPSEGDIVIWGTGEFGHVAVFVEGNATSFRSFDQNLPTGSPSHIQNHTYSGVLGWLVPKTENVQLELEQCRIARDESHMKLVRIADMLKVPIDEEAIKAEINKFMTYEDVIRKKEEELKMKTNEIIDLQARVERLNTQLAELSQTVKEGQETNMKQGVELASQKEQLKAQEDVIVSLGDSLQKVKEDLQVALAKAFAGRSGFEIIWIGIKKLFTM